jgi:nucleoside-diphosphate-sugar epimerase
MCNTASTARWPKPPSGPNFSDVMSERTALVLGAGGGIGGEVAAALKRHGWLVRGFARKPGVWPSDIEWVTGDALNHDDVRRAALGVELIVHAVNPPGYKDWDKVVLPMLENTISAAKAERARILLPGTIYNYGYDAFPRILENAPQHALSKKGRIRVAMEQRLEHVCRHEGVPVTIVRCGDFFGPRPGNNWFSQGVVKPGKPLTQISEPGAKNTKHAWAYLPDVAETMALVVDKELGPFERFHYRGYELESGAMADAIKRVTGKPQLRVKRFPWWLMRLLAPFVRIARELVEMRYLWQQTVLLDGPRLEHLLGSQLPKTPLEVALRETLKGLKLLEVRGSSTRGLGDVVTRDVRSAPTHADPGQPT